MRDGEGGATVAATPQAGGARWPAYAAAGCALAFAAVSVYWGCGGVAGLDTVGAEAVRLSRAGDPMLLAAVWASVVLKVAGAALALAMVRSWGRRFPRRLLLALGSLGSLGLIGYGGVLIAVETSVVAGLIAAPADMDWRGFHGHLYLWDPWFVVWGLLLGLATLTFARGRRT